MKENGVCGGGDVIRHHLSGTRWRKVGSFTPRTFHPRRKQK